MRLKRGDILKLSKEGLNRLYSYNDEARERASKWRFEYRSQARNDDECLSVIKLGTRYNKVYHRNFLEKVE